MAHPHTVAIVGLACLFMAIRGNADDDCHLLNYDDKEPAICTCYLMLITCSSAQKPAHHAAHSRIFTRDGESKVGNIL